MVSSPRLPLYLRSNVSKNIVADSLVVNPNVDFKVYKVLVASDKHILAIDENLILYKFKIKNFVSVNYVFSLHSSVLTSENIQKNSISVSQDIFEICKNFINQKGFYEVFNNNQCEYINDKCEVKINTKIIVTNSKSESIDYHDEKNKTVSWMDHYATIKSKDTKEKLYFSIARNAKVYRT